MKAGFANCGHNFWWREFKFASFLYAHTSASHVPLCLYLGSGCAHSSTCRAECCRCAAGKLFPARNP